MQVLKQKDQAFMLKQKLQKVKTQLIIKNNTVARANKKNDSMFDKLSFSDIFYTMDDDYLAFMAYENPDQLKRMCMFLSLDNQLRLEEIEKKSKNKKNLN